MTKGLVIIMATIVVGTAVLTAVFVWPHPQFKSPAAVYRVPIYPLEISLASDEPALARHLPTPEPLKAVYMTSCVAGTPSLRERLVDLVRKTEINAIVVDLKDYTGALSFSPDDEKLKAYSSSNCPIPDLRTFIDNLHDEGIYVIGRITVFQDPAFAKNNPIVAVKKKSDPEILWADKKGINYIDPGSREAWDHIARIAEDAFRQGVDELNFDYIRYPSDGNMQDISFPLLGDRSKAEVLEEFFVYLHERLKPSGMIISADLFGMTTSSLVDVGIGQIWERTLPYFDYIAPMIYPSHYYNGFAGFTNPNEYPYEIIRAALEPAIARTIATTTRVMTLDGRPIASTTPQLYTKKSFSKGKIRPWLQDFDYPVVYTPAMVRAQIKATNDLGLTSWMMWDPSNRYTKEVYQLEN
jgi:hypothetical protein